METAEHNGASKPVFARRLSWGGTLLVWLAVMLPFLFLYVVSRRAVVNEIRQHAMGVAIAAAAGIDLELLPEVRGVEDVGSPAFTKIQRYLSRQIESNPDIRFIYTMRRSTAALALPSAYEFIVDGPARDFDGDGKIGPDETSEDPGTPYDATGLPALIEAWTHPSADADVSPDPPYPDLISGYAPIRDAGGNTIGLVGVDITARTVAMKLRMIQIVMVCVWLLICVLISLIIHLYYQQNAAFDEIRRLNDELAARHELLRRTSRELSARDTQRVEPADVALRVRSLFDRYDVRAVQIGSAPASVFEVDEDRLAFYLASVPGDSANAPMVISLVGVALNALAEGGASATGTSSVYVDRNDPAAVLHRLAALIGKDLPLEESISILYGVLDLNENTISIAAAGLQFVSLHRRADGAVARVNVTAGAPLRVGAEGIYPAATVAVAEGDRIVIADGENHEALQRAFADGKPGVALADEARRLAAASPGRRTNLVAIEML